LARSSQVGGTVALAVIITVIGFVLANRPFGGVAVQASPSASASSVESASFSSSADLYPTLNASPSDSQDPGSTPLATHTPIASRQATTMPSTPKPTAKPTPKPSPGLVHCIAPPTGWAVETQQKVVAGALMYLDLQGFPTGQKMTLVVNFPDGTHLPLGARYASTPDAGGWTHMRWTWTVPVDMIPGAGTASYVGTCIEGRVYDSDAPFTVYDPNPTPNWSVSSTAYQAWPGGPGDIRVQAYYGAMCTVTVTYPDARTEDLGTVEYPGSELTFAWTVPADVPVGNGSYHVSCDLAGAIRTFDGTLMITAAP
jgi:hypothetical protein